MGKRKGSNKERKAKKLKEEHEKEQESKSELVSDDTETQTEKEPVLPESQRAIYGNVLTKHAPITLSYFNIR